MVTRAGKHDKLASLLASKGLSTAEIPCIQHGLGPDRHRLKEELMKGASHWSYVVVTSPEAAAVLVEGWIEALKPDLTLASIGRYVNQSDPIPNTSTHPPPMITSVVLRAPNP